MTTSKPDVLLEDAATRLRKEAQQYRASSRYRRVAMATADHLDAQAAALRSQAKGQDDD